MIYSIKVSVILILVNIYQPASLSILDASSPFIHNTILLQLNIVCLAWNFTSTDITFKLTVKTTGWVSFALTNNIIPNDSDKAFYTPLNSDLILAWKDPQNNGTLNFKECHTEIVDSQEKIFFDLVTNWNMLFYSNTNGYVTVIFKRKLKVCYDPYEQSIQILPTQFVSWSFGETYRDSRPDFYNPISSGVKNLPLLANLNQQIKLDPNSVSLIEFNSIIEMSSSSDSNDFCQMFKLPYELMRVKQHLVKYETVISVDGLKFLNEWNMLECIPNYESVFL